jgi:hypothetical protein
LPPFRLVPSGAARIRGPQRAAYSVHCASGHSTTKGQGGGDRRGMRVGNERPNGVPLPRLHLSIARPAKGILIQPGCGWSEGRILMVGAANQDETCRLGRKRTTGRQADAHGPFSLLSSAPARPGRKRICAGRRQRAVEWLWSLSSRARSRTNHKVISRWSACDRWAVCFCLSRQSAEAR